MNELEINYNGSKGRKIFLIIAGCYFVLYGIYACVMQIDNIGLGFYLSLAVAVLGAVLILSVTVWASKPLFKIDSESVYVSMPGTNSIYTVEWINVKSVGIGLNYLKFAETDGKDYSVQIGGLKYDDLKEVKSRVIELCEAKNIPYQND